MPTTNTYQKLLEAQATLKAPKSQWNKFGGYSYRSCEDILEALKPILKKLNAVVILSDEIVLIGERYYVKATAKFINCETGETLVNSAYAREEETKKGMDGSQITGTASSYARKYALNGMFDIDDNKDSDGTNRKNKDGVEVEDDAEAEEQSDDEKPKEVKLATPKQIEVLEQVYKGNNRTKLFDANKISSFEELPREKASELIEKLKQKKGA